LQRAKVGCAEIVQKLEWQRRRAEVTSLYTVGTGEMLKLQRLEIRIPSCAKLYKVGGAGIGVARNWSGGKLEWWKIGVVAWW
jgi:hypothetical protein